MLANKLQEIRDNKTADDRGFTLIELLVVVVIIGILVAIAIPLYLNYEQGANRKSVQADIRNAVTAVQACYSDNNEALPNTKDFGGSTAAFPECITNKVTVSDSTTDLAYTNTGATSYTVEGKASGGIDYKYDSTTGKISKLG